MRILIVTVKAATIKYNVRLLKVIKVPESPHYFLHLETETWNAGFHSK